MSWLARFDRFWYAPAPPERLALLRVLVGAFAVVYVAVRYPALAAVTRFHASEFAPVGPLAWLSSPVSPAFVHAALLFTIVAGAGFVLGYRYRFTGPVFAGAFLVVTAYRSSWGMIFHTENLVALHLLVLAVAPAADALSLDARSYRRETNSSHGRYGWPISALCAVTVTTYVLAGVAKLRLAGFDWADGEILRAQVAYDNLRKIELGSWHSPLGTALAGVAWPFRVLAWCTLALELGAPLALLGRVPARVWVAGVFGFHLGVLLLMMIAFPYPLSFVAYLSFFPIERALRSRPYRWLSNRVHALAPALHNRSVARD
ncbi:MAG TPA: HTTM domain-containing protein [Polyangiaceae bacterium]